jgi:hypothetical protein
MGGSVYAELVPYTRYWLPIYGTYSNCSIMSWMENKMIPIYGSLITILLCVFLPPLFDHYFGNKEEWSWSRFLAAYALMIGFLLVLPVAIGGNLYVDWIFVALAIAIAVFIAPVSFIGTLFVLLLSRIILPILILWEISRCAKVKEPMKMILSNTEPRFFAPMALGLLTWLIARWLRQRLRTV